MYILRDDTKIKNMKDFFMCSQVFTDKSLHINWKDGKRKCPILNSNLIPFKFITDSKIEPYDFVLLGMSLFFLGNESVKQCFTDPIRNNEIELIPSEIYNKKKNLVYKYWLFNILNVEKIINIKKSKLSKHSSELKMSFINIILNKKIINESKDIYYEPNMIGEYIISERLAEKIITAGLTGMEVIPVDEYKDKFYNE